MLFDPVTRSSLRPGIVLMHGMPGTARGMAAYAQVLAQHGAVVIAIDAPFARRGGEPVRFSGAGGSRSAQRRLRVRPQPSSGGAGLCGRQDDRLKLMRVVRQQASSEVAPWDHLTFEAT